MTQPERTLTKALIVGVLAGSAPAFLAPQESEAVLRRIADHVLKSSTFHFADQLSGKRYSVAASAPEGANLHLESPFDDWRYWNGVLNIGMMRAGEALGQPAYISFARENISFAFDNYAWFRMAYHGQPKWEYPFAQRFMMEELDDYGAMTASAIEVQNREPQDRYRSYFDSVIAAIGRVHRLEDGTLVRPFPRRWTLWADDLYMSVAFLARMAEFSGSDSLFDDAARQVINFHHYLFDSQKGLMHHCYYSDTKSPGVAFWGRANGWTLLAQVDLLDRLPARHPDRDTLLALLRAQCRSIVKYQSASGLWHQLLDKDDSYLETSCSAMFTYAIARGVNRGYIDSTYVSAAQAGWRGVMSRVRPEGQIEGVCAGTGVSEDLQFYYERPAPLDDPHGIGAVLLAGSEILRLTH